MKKVIRLTENDIVRLVNKVILEQNSEFKVEKNKHYHILGDLKKLYPKFELDDKGKYTGGVPTLSIGNDTDGTVIQLRDKGEKDPNKPEIILVITKNNKELVVKRWSLEINLSNSGSIMKEIISYLKKYNI